MHNPGSMSGAPGTKSVESKPPINLSGTAKDAKDAPPLGLVDIGESQHAYIFWVSLPGVCKPNALDLRNWEWSKIEVKANSKAPLKVAPCAGHSLIAWEGSELI